MHDNKSIPIMLMKQSPCRAKEKDHEAVGRYVDISKDRSRY